MTFDPRLLELATSRNLGVLATVKRDGRPQLSPVNFSLDPATTTVRISVIDGRAKVANLRRDPRASLSVSSEDGWSYAVLEGTAELSPVAKSPDDPTCDALVDVYRQIRGEDHPDWEEYRAVMVADHRLVLSIQPQHVYGLAR